MPESLVLDGAIRWVGEHWVARVRASGDSEDRALVSLYVTQYSPVGTGHVAAVRVVGEQGFAALYADDRELAEYLSEMWISRRSPFRERGLPDITPARFRRSGDVRLAPSWSIETDATHVETTWAQIEPGITAVRPDPEIHRQRAAANVLFFARACTVLVNRQRVDGVPYAHDLWDANIGGGDRSSCVFALAEAFITPPS